MERCKVNTTMVDVLRCSSNMVPMECYLVLSGPAQTLIAVLCCTVGGLCILENTFVLYLIFSSPKIRKKPSYLFLSSLALADTFASFIFVCSFVHFHVFNGIDSTKETFLLKLAGVNTTFTASLGSLLLMAFDRYICILKPSSYKVIVTSRRALVALVILWITIVFLALLPLLGWNCCSLNSACSELFPFVDNTYLLSWVTFVMILLASIVYAYAHVLWKARQHVLYMEKHHGHNSQLNTKVRLDVKLAKTLAIILLVLVTCWSPAIALMTYSIFAHLGNSLKKVFAFCSTLCLVNSMVNPAVYALRSRELSSALRKICSSFKRKVDVSDSNPEAETTEKTFPVENVGDRYLGSTQTVQASEDDKMDVV
ncbi:cannabinoid receptor 2 [Sceloporus undulatus]|uniref:cannabinoid receptor 2 n=1 Tax=Sceloporus undulatus TaxID=8520 RepID=UPI001C4A94C3|nr:cannabinoid receptor 2 [Sceloporus undulatus]